MPAFAGVTSDERSFPRGKLTPRLFRRGVLPGDFSGDEAFGDVSPFHVKMAVDRADLAGDVEVRDRLFHRVEHALFGVSLGACRPA